MNKKKFLILHSEKNIFLQPIVVEYVWEGQFGEKNSYGITHKELESIVNQFLGKFHAIGGKNWVAKKLPWLRWFLTTPPLFNGIVIVMPEDVVGERIHEIQRTVKLFQRWSEINNLSEAFMMLSDSEELFIFPNGEELSGYVMDKKFLPKLKLGTYKLSLLDLFYPGEFFKKEPFADIKRKLEEIEQKKK